MFAVSDHVNSPRPNQVALITGGNSLLAIATARAFLADRNAAWSVWLGVRANRDRAVALATEQTERVFLTDLDVTDAQAWASTIATIVEKSARLDALVNNAGFHRDSLLASMTDDDWHAVIDSNLNGTFHGCRAALTTMMRQRHGRIVNIASLSALLAPKGQTNYAAAKAGIVAMSQSLAKETARAGITVNCVCPGYINTPALDSIPPDQRKALMRDIPMRRFGEPEEIADAVIFLASEKASYITGATLKIDGGIF
ncbi:MAG: 3-oxoacyl-[acyl-carrier protein] reductase [Verrucomicrobiales bacterium]|jgi:3-oxoacyl-[acyl-carrier protein] reductase